MIMIMMNIECFSIFKDQTAFADTRMNFIIIIN